MSEAATATDARGWRPLSSLRRGLALRIAAAVRRRQGADVLPVALQRRRLYILPSRAGVALGALLFLMLLAGLNYGNSLALFLTFLLTAFCLVAMQQCHRNLQGLLITALHAPPVFAGRPATVHLALGNTATHARFGIAGRLDGEAEARMDVGAQADALLALPVAPPRRGILPIGRVRLATTHPFGIFRAWTWLHVSAELVVYPSAEGTQPMPQQDARQPGLQARRGAGVDEWAGLRPFRDGDSPRQVDWKAYAREAPLLVKEYHAAGTELHRFDYAQVRLPDAEARLSQLARWVVDAEARGERYALELPGLSVPADHGPEQRHRCLAALARFTPAAAR
ncbi:MAG: DUF58 domain-containing protein [Proteobacteria bacterium]|nr:DUF58 domain-containing protein [Pseudomonadota bacterium]